MRESTAAATTSLHISTGGGVLSARRIDLNARIEEPNFKRMIGDKLLLSDELIKSLIRYRTPAVSVGIRATRRFAIDCDTEPDRPVFRRRPEAAFDAAGVQSAIREARQLVPGRTYEGYYAKIMEYGYPGHIVSFSCWHVLYFGRTTETHVEHLPARRPIPDSRRTYDKANPSYSRAATSRQISRYTAIPPA